MNVFVVVHVETEPGPHSAKVVGVFGSEEAAVQKATSLPTPPWRPWAASKVTELEWESGYDYVYIEKWGVEP